MSRILPFLFALSGLFLTGCGGPSANVYTGPPLGVPAYRLGVADQISVDVKDNASFSVQNASVRPDGQITMPIIGDINVVGLTPGEVKNVAVKKLSKFIKTPIVTVTLTELNSYEFFVMGNVRAANRYTSNRMVTVLQALAMAGGLTDFAEPDGIVVMRKFPDGEKRIPFDYPNVVNGTKIQQNIFLQSGDIVVVP